MFKFETSVKWILVTAITCVSLTALAKKDKDDDDDEGDSTTINKNNDRTNSKIFDKLEAKGCLTVKASDRSVECKNLYDLYNDGIGDEYGSCKNAEAKYDEALSKLDASCGDLGAKKGGGPSDSWLSCTYNIRQCEFCPNSEAGDDEYVYFKCDKIKVTEEEETPRNNILGGMFGLNAMTSTADTGKATRLMKYCPGRYGAANEDFKEDLKDSEEKVKALEEKMEGLEEKYRTEQNALKDKMLEHQAAQLKAQQEFGEQMAQVDEQKEGKLAEIEQAITDLTAQMSQTRVDLKNTEIAESDAQDIFDQRIVEIELNCNTQATAAVSAMQAQAIDDLRKNRRNLGGFNDMMKRTNLNEKSYWQREAAKVYEDCKKGDATSGSKNVAGLAKAAALRRAEAARGKAKEEQKRIAAEIKKLKSEVGCPAGAAAMQMENANLPRNCAVLLSAQKNAERMAQAYQQNQQMAAMQAQQAQQSGTDNLMSMMQKAEKTQAELQQEQGRLRGMQRIRDLAEKSGRAGSDKEDYDDAKEAYSDFINAARQYASDNCNSVCTNDKCRKAKKFISVFDDLEERDVDVEPVETPVATPLDNPDATPNTDGNRRVEETPQRANPTRNRTRRDNMLDGSHATPEVPSGN